MLGVRAAMLGGLNHVEGASMFSVDRRRWKALFAASVAVRIAVGVVAIAYYLAALFKLYH